MMDRETKTTLKLNEAEIREAVIEFLRRRGEQVPDDAYLSAEGDLPDTIVVVCVKVDRGVEL